MDLKSPMEDSTSNVPKHVASPSSAASERPPAARTPSEAAGQPGAMTATATHEHTESKHEKPSASQSAHHAGSSSGSADHSAAAADESRLMKDFAVHGMHMTIQERHEAQEIMRKKYGAIDP